MPPTSNHRATSHTSAVTPSSDSKTPKYTHLLDSLYLICIAKRIYLCYKGHRLCSNWHCKHDNPPQAVAGQYRCQDCAQGTYIVLPCNTIGVDAYPPPTRPGRGPGNEHLRAVSHFFRSQRRRRAADGFSANLEQVQEDEERFVRPIRDEVLSGPNKPLPATPGLANRIRRTNTVDVNVRPPAEGKDYQPPLRAKHSFAARNRLAGKPLYPKYEMPPTPPPSPDASARSRSIFDKQGSSTRLPVPFSSSSVASLGPSSIYSQATSNGRTYI